VTVREEEKNRKNAPTSKKGERYISNLKMQRLPLRFNFGEKCILVGKRRRLSGGRVEEIKAGHRFQGWASCSKATYLRRYQPREKNNSRKKASLLSGAEEET